MLPIGPLMIEHRVIERMIALMKKETQNIREKGTVRPVFLDASLDFIRTYADRCHHGKEEDILFRELEQKELTPAHQSVMAELVQEHILARNTVKKLIEAKDRFQKGDTHALEDIAAPMEFLVEFYPKHIDKEDNHFFRPCMEYFSKSEQDAMLRKFYDFDRTLIHLKYKGLVESFETAE